MKCRENHTRRAYKKVIKGIHWRGIDSYRKYTYGAIDGEIKGRRCTCTSIHLLCFSLIFDPARATCRVTYTLYTLYTYIPATSERPRQESRVLAQIIYLHCAINDEIKITRHSSLSRAAFFVSDKINPSFVYIQRTYYIFKKYFRIACILDTHYTRRNCLHTSP